MKYGIAVVWDGPTDDKKIDDTYLKTVDNIMTTSLLDINKEFKRQGLPQCTFVLMRGESRALKKDLKNT